MRDAAAAASRASVHTSVSGSLKNSIRKGGARGGVTSASRGPEFLEFVGHSQVAGLKSRVGQRSEELMFTTLTCLAAVSFSVGGYYMKLSAGLTHFRPTALMFIFFSIGAVLQTVAMSGEEMSITYIVVLGFEAITALCL